MINREQLEADVVRVMEKHGIGHVVFVYGSDEQLAMFGAGFGDAHKIASDAIQDAIKGMDPDLTTVVEDALLTAKAKGRI